MSATFLSSLATPEWLLTPSAPAFVNSAISAASALIPSPSSDFQLLTFNFQPPLRHHPPACPNPVEALARKSSPYFASSLLPCFLFSKPCPYLVTSLLPYFLFSKSFICNTYASPRKCCKQKTYGKAKPFRCNTYRKHGGGAAIMVNQALETSRPTSSPALCLGASEVSSAFRLPYTLPSSVSRNPFVCATPLFATLTKTAGVCTNNSHSGTCYPTGVTTSLSPYLLTSLPHYVLTSLLHDRRCSARPLQHGSRRVGFFPDVAHANDASWIPDSCGSGDVADFFSVESQERFRGKNRTGSCFNTSSRRSRCKKLQSGKQSISARKGRQGSRHGGVNCLRNFKKRRIATGRSCMRMSKHRSEKIRTGRRVKLWLRGGKSWLTVSPAATPRF